MDNFVYVTCVHNDKVYILILLKISMGKDNIQYINLKEKDVLGRYLNEALKQIEKEQNYLKERFENLEWARLQEDKTVINKFLEKIILVRLVPGDD